LHNVSDKLVVGDGAIVPDSLSAPACAFSLSGVTDYRALGDGAAVPLLF
jgi:hypothetical protein